MELWTECLKGNKKAWVAMREYNIFDVLATEELYKKLIPFGSPVNFSVYYEGDQAVCSCGNTKFINNGHYYTAAGKFQRRQCTACRSSIRAKTNLFKGIIRKVS